MSLDERSEPPGVVVPVDVVAFCVGTIDATESTSALAGSTVDYSKLRNTYLGSAVDVPLTDPPLVQLERGVHLHWALPDGLTQATTADGTLEFRAVPDRWSVTRYVAGSTVAPRSWIVESDLFLTEAPAGQTAVTVPAAPGPAGTGGFRYMGYRHDVDEDSPVPAPSLDPRATPLTAVTNGLASFAPYYPECRSVFGLHDRLDDVESPVDPDQLVELTYVVSGWYGDEARDPMRAAPDASTAREVFGWTWRDSGPRAEYSVYHGEVAKVGWNTHRRYVPDKTHEPTIEAEVAIGNTPAEALAAYFQVHDQPDDPFYEQLLELFMSGRADILADPEPDQVAGILDWLYDLQFGRTESGTLYEVARRADAGPDADTLALSEPIADALNRLNRAELRRQAAIDAVAGYRRELFCEWYRVFATSGAQQDAAVFAALYRWRDWDVVDGARRQAEADRDARRSELDALLPDLLEVTESPMASFRAPAEPSVLLTTPGSTALRYPERYGGDRRRHESGFLECRRTDELQRVESPQANAALGDIARLPRALPHHAVHAALRREACLRHPGLLADGAALELGAVHGTPSSPVALADWGDANPWEPIFLHWKVCFRPVQPTYLPTQPRIDYATDFVVDRYEVGSASGSYLRPIEPVDPASLPLQEYRGAALLSPVTARGFAAQIDTYLDSGHTDPTLARIRQQLDEAPFLVQPLTGFDNALLTLRQSVQMRVEVPTKAKQSILDLTRAIRDVISGANALGPAFRSYFNPVRAGFLSVDLQVVDAYGQRRDVVIERFIRSAAMTDAGNPKADGYAYLAPRYAQPHRLGFHWMSADDVEITELNDYSDPTPICGWLVPDHLAVGFFFYDQDGMALGALQLDGDGDRIVWQSAPGNDATIDQTVAEVFAETNAQLRDLAVSLSEEDTNFFRTFWRAVDRVHGTVAPADIATNAGMAVLVGRPVALLQATLRIETLGPAALNHTLDAFAADPTRPTDNRGAEVRCPVVLGDVDKVDDGLVGFFRTEDGRYDLGTFFSADGSDLLGARVVRPTQSTVTLAPADRRPEKLLLLVDPRASVHATTGMLPTASLTVPPDRTAAALSVLELSLLVAPALRGDAAFQLPVPAEPGFAASWVGVHRDGGGVRWHVTPDLDAPNGAVWPYTPQRAVEGWLRFNPDVLPFAVFDAAGVPVVRAARANDLRIVATNRKPGRIVLRPSGVTAIAIRFGGLVAAADVERIGFAADGWDFRHQGPDQPGEEPYWLANPTAEVVLDPGTTITFVVSDLVGSDAVAMATVYFDYTAIDGLNDGVAAVPVTVEPVPAQEVVP